MFTNYTFLYIYAKYCLEANVIKMRRNVMYKNSPVVAQVLQGDIGILWVWNFSLPVSRQKYELQKLFVVLPEEAVFLKAYNHVKFNIKKEERIHIFKYAIKIAQGFRKQYNIEKEIEEKKLMSEKFIFKTPIIIK